MDPSTRARFLLVGLGWSCLAAQAAGQTFRVSVDSSGAQADLDNHRASLSADGRWVVFESEATNLVPGDTNGLTDIFLHDRQSGITLRVSVGPGGLESNGDSTNPSVSADGQRIAFRSLASNLVAGDSNGVGDVFVHMLTSGTTQRASVSSAGLQANGASASLRLSADGSVVAFSSLATNLVPGDTNGAWDAFVHVLASGLTERVSLSGAGLQGDLGSFTQGIAADGRHVAFTSDATNLVPGDTNGARDAFLHDRLGSSTVRVSVGSGGFETDGPTSAVRVNANGTVVCFDSAATNLVPGDTNGVQDVFARDLASGITSRVSVSSQGDQTDGETDASGISGDGRLVNFTSLATNLVPGDTNGVWDIFVHDRFTGATQRVSVSSAGIQASDENHNGFLAASGTCVSFDSAADNLVPGDTNGVYDAFVRELGLPCAPPITYCTGQQNSLGCTSLVAFSGWPSVSQPDPFVLSATQILSNVAGLLIYSKVGPASLPFNGGTLCIAAPLWRTTVQFSRGNPPPVDCSGTLTFDFDAYVASGTDLELVPGTKVWVQFWSRDPGLPPPTNSNLTDAVAFELCP
jgi:Tol biopolymer transport system component